MGTVRKRIQKELQQLYFLYNPYNQNEDNRVKEIIIPDFIIPDSISHEYSPNFSSNSVLGRLSPVLLYSGGSARTLSFSIRLNDDIARQGGYESLVELVDDIKSLSYPVRERSSNRLPQVYFQLGELVGVGIVQTSISWSKPFDNTRGIYKLVEVAFTITLERELPLPKFLEAMEVIDRFGLDEVEFEDKLVSSISEERAIEAQEVLSFLGFTELSVADFINTKDGGLLGKELARRAESTFEYNLERVATLYESLPEAISKDLKVIKSFKDNYSIETLKSNQNAMTKSIQAAKDEFRRSLQAYFQKEFDINVQGEIPIDMTQRREEYFLLLDQVFSVLEQLEASARAVYTYGSGD